jgi:hypothetical protein
MKFILLEAITIPKMAKANTKSITIISAQQIKLESYQVVIDFLKNGLGSKCILFKGLNLYQNTIY